MAAKIQTSIDPQYFVQLKAWPGSPLLMHQDDVEWADLVGEKRTEIKEKNKAEFRAGDDRCPPQTWRGYLYNDGENVTIPTDNLRKALTQAGGKITLKNAETFKKVVPAAIMFDDLWTDFRIESGKIPVSKCVIDGPFVDQLSNVRKLGFDLFTKRAPIGSAKHIRVRPIFRNWTAEFSITIVDSRVTEDILERLWAIAGQYAGVGDWRPSSPRSPGPYGRFTASITKM